MKRLHILSLAALFAAVGASKVRSQNSTAAPLSSSKEDKDGDPTGAIRALEDTSRGETTMRIVTIPPLGAEEHSRTGGPPPETSSGSKAR